jgi:thioredoxin-related protein
MKKNVIAVFIISLITVSFLFFEVSASAKKTNENLFSGRVIFVTDNYVELKKGKIELVIYFADTSKYISRDGKDLTKKNTCQNYLKQTKRLR